MQKSTVVILDSGAPCGADGPAATAATAATAAPRRALDWVVHAFNTVLDAEFHLVSGYPHDAVLWPYPGLSILIPPRGTASGSIGALLAAPLREDRACYVTRADLVVRSRLIDRLAAADGDAVVVVDRRRRGHPGEGSGAAPSACACAEEDGAALVGIARLSRRAVERLLELRARGADRLANASLPELIRELVARGLEVRAVESEGDDWARLAAPQDLARFALGTKAESLERLRPLVTRSTIGAQVRCSVAEWRAAPEDVLARVAACFGARALAVRSSARSEDAWTVSRAGHFTSVLDVAADRAALSRAIDGVIASYGGAEQDDQADQADQADQQVLIQEMLESVQLSGVVFTRTLSHHMPYYTINYDDTTTRTGCVTSGAGKDLRTVVIHRRAAASPDPDLDPRLAAVLRAVRELEELVGHDALDVELALDPQGAVHVLQLRPIVATRSGAEASEAPAAPEAPAASDALLEEALEVANARLERARVRGPGLVGRHAYFGVMPDWNPAEIIGARPRRLALGLYRHLVTDEVWAIQRAECGYRDVRPHPLLIALAGQPYIDIRVSLNSFVPASLDDELAGRLVDHYLRRLRRDPHLHDKLELDVALTCLAFDFDRRARDELRPAGFTAAELERLRAGLQHVTRQIMNRCPQDLEAIDRLAARHDALLQLRLDPLERAHALLEDCRCYGTLPFAHLARGAFVAITLLRSLTAVGICAPAQQAAFLGSLSTVARSFERDGSRVAAGHLPWDDFVRRYRHLRPGTYELTSPSYGDDPERFLRPATLRAPCAGAGAPPAGGGEAAPVWSGAIRRAIDDGLARLGLPGSAEDLERFLRAAIEGRERSKFVFTRNLSQALDDLAAFARAHGCDREQLSHVDLESVLQLRQGVLRKDVAGLLAARAREGAREHRVTLGAQLPALIFEPRHLLAFERFRSQPNFVTSKRVVAPLVELPRPRQAGGQRLELGGRLVLVPQADPGYDWLFGHPLAGLITMYGGANSHLAIRAAEANLPAAIGVGEPCYERLARARVIEMDCAGQQIRLIQ